MVGEPPQEQVLNSVMRMGTFASAAARTPSEFQEVYEGTNRRPPQRFSKLQLKVKEDYADQWYV